MNARPALAAARRSVRRSVIWLLPCLLTTATPWLADAGTLRGTVRAQPREVPGADGGGGKYDSRRYKFLDKVNYTEIRDFVVYLDEIPAEKPTPPKQAQQIVTQKDGMFRPHVLPLVAGTTVEWPNKDDIFHNVFSFSEPKQFDLGLYKNELKQVTFDQAGRVDVFCSIHSQMHCILLVLPTDHYTSTDAQGRFELKNLPAGKHKFKAWHERMPATVLEVDIPATGEVTQDFVLSIKSLPQI